MDFPVIMGILNVTPDSFSDGGSFVDPDSAIHHGMEMALSGANIIDVGGESTRPGAQPIPPEEQKSRVIPVIRELSKRVDIPISVDTRSADVAAAAIEAGAAMVNDVSGFLFDPDMPAILGKYRPLAVAMHMRGTPENMRSHVDYKAILWEIASELMTGVDKAVAAGLPFENVWLDPGIGFAKTAQQSLVLMANLRFFKALGRPLVVGPSKKSFLEPIIHKPVEQRDWGTAAAVAWAVAQGADCVRVHDVGPMKDVVTTIKAMREAMIG
jgi:dihydropteroate synthase